jgi:hypothetical protein
MKSDVQKFEAAVRKADRMIAALQTVAIDETSSVRALSAPISKMIDRLYTLHARAMYAEGADDRYANIPRLLSASLVARDALQARITSFRCAKMREFEIERARIANGRPY